MSKGTKKGGKLKWVIIAVVVIAVIGVAAGSGGDNQEAKKTGEVSTSSQDKDSKQEGKKEETSNVFHAGDVVETDDFKITFLSAGQHQEDNEFTQPKEGYEYWKFEFQFENISDSDKTVSSMVDWECYADNAKVDQSWIGDNNGLDATLSSGRTTLGAIFFEVPVEAEKIELEYDISFFGNDKIIFVGK